MNNYDLTDKLGALIKTVQLPERTETVVYHCNVYIWSDAYGRYVKATSTYEPTEHHEYKQKSTLTLAQCRHG